MHTITKTTKFHAAHFVVGHPICGKLHGHTYRSTVEIAVADGQLDSMDIGVDYHVVKKHLEEITKDEFDHTLLNEHPAFKDVNPTAERISEYIFNRLKPIYASYGGELLSVTVNESDTTSARYDQRGE